MQCPSCAFENLPGSKLCARCETVLDLESRQIDVHPPRSRHWKRSQLALTRQRNTWRNFTERVLGKYEPRGYAGIPYVSVLTPLMFVRLLVSGWPQFILGRRIRGWIYLFGYLLLMVWGLLFLGTGWGIFFLGMAMSLHAGSIADAFGAPDQGVFRSISLSVAAYLAVLCLCYGPLVYTVSRFIQPYTIQQSIPGFQEDDILWLRPRVTPKAGDMIAYNRTAQTLEAVDHRRIRWDGPTVERVLAVAGDVVEFRDGFLYVNQVPSKWQTTQLVQGLNFTTTIAPRQLFVIPLNANLFFQIPPEIMPTVMVIGNEQVVGVVYFRSYPWSRSGFIR